MTTRSKGWLAAFLSSAWMILVAVELMRQPSPERVPLKFKSGPPQEIAGNLPQGSSGPFTVRLARAKTHELPHLPSHNIFAPITIPGQEEPARQVKRQIVPGPAKTPSPQPPAPAPIVAEPPPPPSDQELAAQKAIREAELARLDSIRELSAFRFLGFLERDGVAQAFLARGNELYVVANGDTVEGKYVITVLDTSSVKILATRTGIEATIGKSEREAMP